MVLLCDEPFAAGDPLHVRALAKLLRGHADSGRAVLIADHRLVDTLAICDQALFLAEWTRSGERAGGPALGPPGRSR